VGCKEERKGKLPQITARREKAHHVEALSTSKQEGKNSRGDGCAQDRARSKRGGEKEGQTQHSYQPIAVVWRKLPGGVVTGTVINIRNPGRKTTALIEDGKKREGIGEKSS